MLSLNTNIYASESMDSNEYSIIETFSDGSYIKSVLIDDSTDCSSLARKTSTKTGRRVYSYESSSGKLLWTITITGTFSYTGSSAKCTKSENFYNLSCKQLETFKEKSIYIWLIS